MSIRPDLDPTMLRVSAGVGVSTDGRFALTQGAVSFTFWATDLSSGEMIFSQSGSGVGSHQIQWEATADDFSKFDMHNVRFDMTWEATAGRSLVIVNPETCMGPDCWGISTLTIAGGGLGVHAGAYSESPIASVPEPSTYAMLMVGLLGIGMLRRRRALPRNCQ